MSDQSNLANMTCDELLRELARLSSERDHLQADIGTPAQASATQAPQVAGLFDQTSRMDQIGELLKEKKCQGML
jgi:hypothetical protein